MAIVIEKGIEHPPTHCDCCGRATRSLNGYADDEMGALATYLVHWTEGHVEENGANFDLIVGTWGGAPTADRVAASLAYRITGDGPQFMVIDANQRPIAKSSLVGRSLTRDEVLGTPLASQLFSIVDAILIQDERVTSLLGDWRILARKQP